MQIVATKNDLIASLKKEVLSLEGYSHSAAAPVKLTGLADIEAAFPNHTFPVAAVHEFISDAETHAASTNGFMAGIISQLMNESGICIWVSDRRTLFPAGLQFFGIQPERILFVDTGKQKESLWAIEEALKCNAVSCVVGELKELSFSESRRLQLAVEKSKVTGFIHRYKPRNENTTACLTRWRISSIAGGIYNELPGLGFARWNVELLKVRNGRPGAWQLEWNASGFQHIDAKKASVFEIPALKTG